ncbi:hypothetical protein [Thalassotalea litorea]|uniref:hypothetical protein n=1 Tax=Thalassotalea litorea TaxID=2020715 RepID=UPI0014850A61|nr:hypothetical protein [Thalassotalea litorea]
MNSLIFISIALFSCQSLATALKYRSFTELVLNADAIMQGQVQQISSRRLDNGTIVTFVTLTNLDLHRGDYAFAEFTLVSHGGEVNGLVQKIQGAPQFKLAQNLILFLQGNGKRMVPISGWGQGMFVVNENMVHDYQLNPVLGIVNDQIQVQRLTVPDVILIGAPEPAETTPLLTPMTEAQFIESISRVTVTKRTTQLESVHPETYTLPRHNATELKMSQQ